ncbi:MAG: hypothetical protein ACJ71B_10420 [Nitrososphaera sp.]
MIFSQKIENLVHNSAGEYRCNGGYENDVMEGMMIMASFTGLTVYRIMTTQMAEGPDIFQSKPDA